jgi:hypothetical protein
VKYLEEGRGWYFLNMQAARLREALHAKVTLKVTYDSISSTIYLRDNNFIRARGL